MRNFLQNLKNLSLLTLLLMGSINAWADYTTKITSNGVGSTGPTSKTENGVTFSIGGDFNTNKTSDYYFIYSGSTGQVSWTPPTGYDVAVKSVSVRAKNQKFAGTGTGYIYTSNSNSNNKTQVCKSNSYGTYSYSNSNASTHFPSAGLGNNGKIYFYAQDREFHIQWIEFTYTKTAHAYTITFDGNGSTSGSTASVNATYDQDVKLTKNGFEKRKYTVTYNANGGNCAKSIDPINYKFLGWAKSANGSEEYVDEQILVKPNLTATNGDSYPLYAKWGEPASTTVTLPNVVRDGYVLEGWYDGETKVGEAGQTYTVTKNVTLVANLTQKFDPEFPAAASFNLMVDGEQTNAFTFNHAPSPVAHITVKSISTKNNGDGQVISYDATSNRIIAHNAGVAEIYFTQAATSTNYQGTSPKYTYTVSKYETSFDGLAYNLMVDGEQTANYSWTNTSAAQPTASSSNDFYYTIDQVSFTNSAKNKGTNLVTFNPSNNNKITACNAGTAKITLHQKETYKFTGATKSFDVAVYKYKSTFANAANLNVNVEAEVTSGYTLTYSKPNNEYVGTTPETGNPSSNTGDYYYTLTQNVTSTNTTGSADATIAATYDAGTRIATGKNAGTCTVNLYQKENYKFNAAQTSFVVTVAKNDPVFTWNGGSSTYYHNTTVNNIFSSSNTDFGYTIGNSTDAEVAYVSGNTLNVLSKNGNAHFTVTQAANYKWNSKSETYTVTPTSQSNHVPFTVSSSNYTTFKTSNSSNVTWSNPGFRLCDGGWSEKDDYVVIAFTGVPDTLTFDRTLGRSAGFLPGTYECHVYASADGSNWGSAIWSYNEREENASGKVQVPATARYLKFTYHGTVYCYYKNIKVTELKKFTPNPTELDFGALNINTTGSATQKTFEFNYANVGHNVTLSTDDSHFTVSPTSITNIGGEKSGKTTITVNYSTAELHKATGAKLTITDELSNSTNVTLKGETKKLTPTVNWSTDESIFIEDDELSATNANGLTVALSVPDADVQYVHCEGNTATIVGYREGTITVTATVTGNDIYNDATFTKNITITNLTKQTITWTQDLSHFKTTDGTKSKVLDATASSGLAVTYELVGDATGLSLTQNGNTWTLTYSAQECKNTTLVAKQGGNSEYAPASSVSIPVRVIDPTKVCDPGETLVNSSITLKESSVTYNIDIPESMKISLSRVKTGLLDVYLFGVDVEFYSGRNGTGTKLYTKSYEANDINKSISNASISLSSYIHAKSVKVVTSARNGYYLTSLSYTKRKYCNISDNSLAFATYPNTVSATKTFTVSYANYPISVECSNPKFTVSLTEFGDCDEYDTKTISVYYTAGAAEGTDNGYIYIKDNTGVTLKTCTLNVSISKVDQSITNHNIANTYNTTDLVTLTAETNSAAEEKHFTYSADPAGIASFDGNEMTFNQSGTIAITIREAGSDVYKPCSTTVANVVVNKVTPTLTLPTGTNVTYLQKLSTSTLNGGKATVTLRGVENTEVAGSFAWTNGSAQTNGAAGNNSYEVTFTPTDGGMYNPATGMVTVMVDKANQTIEMNNGTVSVAVDKGLDANSEDSKLNLTDLIVSQTTDAFDANRTGAVTYEIISGNSANATISGTIFSATAEGSYTIRATKAATNYYNAATAEFSVTASVRANNLSIAGACTRYVGQEVTDVIANVNSDAAIQTSSSAATIAYYDIELNKIVIPNSEAKSFNDTTVTITIWQDGNVRFAASGEKTIKVKVKKYDNAITCDWGTWSKDLIFNEGVNVHFSSNNTAAVNAPIVVEQVTGLENATYYPQSDAIYASFNIGSATWSVYQEENYMYKAALAKTLTVNIHTISTPSDCYVLNETAEHQLFGVAGVQTGEPMELSAPGKDLYFDAKRDVAGENYFFIEYSTNGSQYKVLGNEVQLSTSYETYGPYELPEGTTHIRFKTTTGATLTKHYKNVHVTRKTVFDIEDKDGAKIDTVNIPLNIVSVDPFKINSSKKSFYLDYNTCADEIHVSSNHPYYTVKVADQTFSASATSGVGRREIEITYTCAEADSSSAVISVYTKYEHQTITMNGRTDKGTQEIIWKEPDFVTDTVSLPVGYTGTAATTSSKLPLKYSIEQGEDSVIRIAEDKYSFEVIGLGTAHLTVTQEGTETLYPVTGTRVINATSKKLQVIRWFQDLTNSLFEGDTVRLEAEVFVMNPKTGVYAKDEVRTDSIRYTCPENNGKIVIFGKDSLRVIGTGETTLTASVPGDDFYEESASITMLLNIHSLSDTCQSKLLIDSKKEYMFEPSIDWGFSGLNLTKAEYGDTILINQAVGKPDKLSFEHCGEAYTIIGKEYYQGHVKAQQRIRGAWVDVPGSRIAPTKGVWNELKNVQLDEDADAILIMREENAYGTHFVKNVKVTMLPYLRADKDFYISAEAGATVDTTITVGYANAKAALTAKTGRKENDTLSVRTSIFYPNCGTIGTYNWPIRFNSDKVGAWMDSITIKDSGSNDSIVVYVHANVTPGAVFVYESETGGIWGDTVSWNHGTFLPTSEDHVIIKSDVIIPADTTVYVKSLAVEATATVYVRGKLIVMESTPDKANYGNIHVKEQGTVDLSNITVGGLKVQDFILDASIGNVTYSSASGQVHGDGKLDIRGDAYFQISFDPRGKIDYGWYDFTVPFEVDAKADVFDKNGNKLTYNVDYAIMDFSEEKRAANAKYWNWFSGTLQPNRLYSITLDDEKNWNTFLFKKKSSTASFGTSTYSASYTNAGETNDRGWNGMGNGTLRHCQLNNLPAQTKILAYDHENDRYIGRDADKYTYAVGTTFFVQVDEEKDVDLTSVSALRGFLAPARNDGRSTDEFRLALTSEDGTSMADQLWFSASEEATEAYVIGRDLLKMGTPTNAKVAQMWATKGGKSLCDVEVTLVNDEAITPLAFFTPQAGEYMIAIEQAPDDADLYLTYNGEIIWDLTASPYMFELSKGTTNAYGLKMVTRAPKVATGVDNADAKNAAMRKVIINDKVYVITPEGKMYDVIGKCVKY